MYNYKYWPLKPTFCFMLVSKRKLRIHCRFSNTTKLKVIWIMIFTTKIFRGSNKILRCLLTMWIFQVGKPRSTVHSCFKFILCSSILLKGNNTNFILVFASIVQKSKLTNPWGEEGADIRQKTKRCDRNPTSLLIINNNETKMKNKQMRPLHS